MNRRVSNLNALRLSLLAWMGLLLPVFAQAVNWNTLDMSKVVPGELLVGYKQSTQMQAMDVVHQRLRTSVLRTWSELDAQAVRFHPGTPLAQVAVAYLADPNVAYVEPNYLCYPLAVPNDPRYDELYGMERINAPDAWDITTGSSNFVVAVIDTGVLLTHEDLRDNIWVNPGEDLNGDGVISPSEKNGIDDDSNGYVDDFHGWDFIDDDNDPTDTDGHGTHCSGTIGGVGDNGRGVAGVNWNIKIAAIKFLPGGSVLDATDAVNYCRIMGFQLSNNSWGGAGYSFTLENAIRLAGEEANHLFIAAAGNDTTDIDAFSHIPASYDLDNLISVAAINSLGQLAYFSNYGKTSVDLAAPGVGILSSVVGSPADKAYAFYDGTSMAAPHVCGAAALIWNQFPSLPYGVIRDAIMDGVAPNANLVGKTVTGGELDLFGAIRRVGGAISFDQTCYNSSNTVNLSALDANETNAEVNIILDLLDSAETLLTSTNLVATNAPPLTDYNFDASHDLTLFSPAPSHGDTLRAVFTDSFGSTTTNTALIDNIFPVLSDFQTLAASDDQAVIQWRSDEPVDSQVIVSDVLPGTGLEGMPTQGSVLAANIPIVDGMVTQYLHEILVTDLDSTTLYYTAVLSQDCAGNLTTYPSDLSSSDPNDYLRLVTLFRRTVSVFDFEEGPDGWTVNSINNEVVWELGDPVYGPGQAYSGDAAWGTVLDDRYPNSQNASLTSPSLAVKKNPRIAFHSWHRFSQLTEYPDPFDFGQIEVNSGSGWENRTPDAQGIYSTYLFGENPRWSPVRLDLPEIEDSAFQLRFRMETTDSGRDAGWYIDHVTFSETLPPGLNVVDYTIRDDLAGDGDGFPEPGESFYLDLTLFNSSSSIHYSNVIANVELPTAGVNLTGSLVQIHYADLAPGASAFAVSQLWVSVDAAVPPGTLASVFHDAIAENESPFQDSFTFEVGLFESISGVVTDLFTGAAIDGADVTGLADGTESLSAVTLADGSYELPGARPGLTYQVSAQKPGSYSRSTVQSASGPQGGVDFGLGQAYLNADPVFFDWIVNEGQDAAYQLTLDNTTGTVSLVYSASIRYLSGPTDGWLSMDGISGTLPVGSTQSISLDVASSGLTPGQYRAEIILDSNDIGGGLVTIPVFLSVNYGSVLYLAEVQVMGGDGDPYPGPSETFDLNLLLGNRGSFAGVFVEGTVVFTGNPGDAVMGDDQMAWPFIYSDSVEAADDLADFTIGSVSEGTLLPFSCIVTDAYGSVSAFDFTLTSTVRYAISGTVEDSVSMVLEGVQVRAEGPVSVRAVTDASGKYSFFGLEDGTYSVSVDPPLPYSRPPLQSITISGADASGVDFVLSEWLVSTSPTSMVYSVKEGMESNVLLEVINNGPIDGSVSFWVETRSGIPLSTLDVSMFPSIPWDEIEPGDVLANEVLVLFKENVDPSAQSLSINRIGAQRVKTLRGGQAALLRTSSNRSLQSMVEVLMEDPDVLWAEPNYLLELCNVPNDPLFNSQYALRNTRQTGGTQGADIRVVDAWDTGVGAKSTPLAILDTGIYAAHEDLYGNMYVNPNEIPDNGMDDDGNGYVDDWQGWDFGDGDNDANPDIGFIADIDHGTQLAGVAGAMGNNGVGIAGVNWNVSLLPLKISRVIQDPVTDSSKLVYPLDAAIEALDYAVAEGVKISSHSYHITKSYFSGLQYASIMAASTQQHLLVCAAGNAGEDADFYPSYPAAYNLPNIISVAAADEHDLLSNLSNYGQISVDIAAPGVDVLSTANQQGIIDTYLEESGTSLAAAHVSGVAALLKSIAPGVDDQLIKQAILQGVRKDVNLEGLMTSGGHLDTASAVELLKNFWLTISPEQANIASGSSTQLVVTLNAGAHLLAGSYSADIVVQEDANGLKVPVSLTVSPAPVPRVEDVFVLGGDGDGWAEPGETVELSISLENVGSGLFLNSTGQISSADSNVVVLDAVMQWPGILSGDSRESTDLATIQILSGATNPAVLQLDVENSLYSIGPLEFDLAVETRYSVTGRVRDAQTQTGLSGVSVEYWGEDAGSIASDVNGDYRLDGLLPGSYWIRPLPRSHEKPEAYQADLLLSDAEHNFDLRKVAVSTDPDRVEFGLVRGQSDVTPLVLSNALPDDFEFELLEFPKLRALVVSDGPPLAAAVAILEQFGMQVDVLSSNLPQARLSLPEPLYTEDEALLLGYDLIVAELEGPRGGGRLLTDVESDILSTILDRGKTIILTGESVLSQPDDRLVAELLGLDSFERSGVLENRASPRGLMTNSVFATLNAAQDLAITEQIYDLAQPGVSSNASPLLSTIEANKLTQRTNLGGNLILWNGQAQGSEWAESGVMRDLLKTLILELFQQDIPWLDVSPTTASVASGELVTQVMMNSTGLPAGTNSAVLLVKGNYPGADLDFVPVEFFVQNATLRAFTSQGVKNWLAEPLLGNGGSGSDLLQLIYAGADGLIDPPTLDGRVTGDDQILRTSPAGIDYGRFGAGVVLAPNQGLFDILFTHGLLGTTPSRNVYVRAWDAASFAESVAYGNSALYTVQVTVDESHDFSGWTVSSSIGYPSASAPDFNGDSIPDGYYIDHGGNPREPIAPLEPRLEFLENQGKYGSGVGDFAFPSRTFVTEKFIFVLDRENNRIQAIDRVSGSVVDVIGTRGSGTNEFSQPYGLDGNVALSSLVVADSGNDRIQILNFDPISGVMSFLDVIGSVGTGNGQFNDPRDIAVGPLGNLYVADTDNHRVQVLDPSGNFVRSIGSYGSLQGLFNTPQGIGIDASGLIYVADTLNHRVQVFNGGGGFLYAFGSLGASDGYFDQPMDVEIGFDQRIFVTDTANHRLQIFDSSRAHIASLGGVGSLDGQFRFPTQFNPSHTNAIIVVADTWNHRIQILSYILDGDGDGMDDTWERVNGLDPLDPSDGLTDADGDGVLNIGEWRIETDPQEGDTDGDGASDRLELDEGTDPLDPLDFPSAELEITAWIDAPPWTISWSAVSGGVYQIESRSSHLSSNAWTALSGTLETSAITGTMQGQVDTNVLDRAQFYRVIRIQD